MYKKYNRFKKIKNQNYKKRKEKKSKKKEKGGRKKENSTELQKPNIEAEVYKNSRKCD